MMKLDPGQKRILTLINKDKSENGWAPVSQFLCELVSRMPKELVEFEPVGDKGRARLTVEGNRIVEAMAWL